MKIAFIGLGRMGAPMAAHLKHDLIVCDAVPELARQWQQDHGGTTAHSPLEAVADADMVITSLPADKELRAVVAAARPSLKPGAVWVDHSTTSAQVARELAGQLIEIGVAFLDAPVSGGVDGARNGKLTVMVGGDEQAYALAESVMAAYAQRITHMGASGAGQITKMTNQICVIGLCQALAEGLDFASRAGLDTEKVVEVMLQGSSTSWQMQNRADKMLAGEYDFGFSTALMRKDLGLVLQEANAMNASLPVTALVGQFLADVESMGGRQWDWCSLMERQRQFVSPKSE